MSSFNPNQHKLTAAEWQEIAKDRNEETGAQFTIIGGVVLALFAGAAASPITGLLVAGYFGYKAWQDTQAANRNEEAIESYGCVAHLLKASDLKDYARQVGSEVAAAEITFALENGYRATNAAIDFVESQGVDVDALMSPTLSAAKAKEAETPEIDPEPPLNFLQSEIESLAGADAAATPEPTASPDSKAPTPIATPATPLPACPMRYLIGGGSASSGRLRTSLIVSVSGGGKDILLSNALRAFLKLYPDFQVLVMDCKDDSKETGYYANLPNVKFYRLNVSIASDAEVVRWVDDCITDFVYLPEKALLICNEGTLVRKKSQRYVDAVDGLVSSGDSRQKFAWEAGQSAHTNALKIDGDGRSRFRLLLIGMKGEEMQVEAILQAKCVADSARNMNEVKMQMMRSPVARAWCDGQSWYAMPKLQNHSGYDRDSRQFEAGYATPQQRQTRERLEGIYREESPSTSPSDLPDLPSTFPEGSEAGKEPSENLEGAEGTAEVAFPRSDDWRKFFPEAPSAIEEVTFRAYCAFLEGGKGKADFIAEVLKSGTGGRRYQAASKYLDYLSEKFGGKS